MKRFLLFAFCLFTAITSQAQFPGGGSTIKGRISATVLDSATKKPIDYATITLFRSGGKVPLNGGLTDEKGVFKLDNISTGNYKISVTFIGYTTKIIDPVKTTPEKPDANLGTIYIAAAGRTLNEVKVVGQAPLIENKIDKIVFNAEKDLTSTGGNASDVLRKVPLVSVDLNGNVSLRGDQNVRVLINGKPSGAMANNLADVLRSLPADQIKNIEVITAPSAKYDAEGSGGIINIITKKKDISGVSGSVSGGVGTRQNNGNVNLNINKNRLSITGNVGGNYTWPQTTKTTFSSILTNGNSTATNLSNGDTKITRYAGIGSASASYDINSVNSLSSTIRFNQGGFRSDGLSNSSYQSPSLSQLFTTTSDSKNTFGGFDWNADYTHKFKTEGEEFTISGQWSRSKTITDLNTLLSAERFNNSQIGNNDGINNEYTFQADYAKPFNKTVKLELGAKSILRRLTSDYVYLSPDASGQFVFNPNTSNNYGYNQDVYAGYAVLSLTLKNNYGVQLGARYENTGINGSASNTNQGLQPFSNDYNTFIPSIVISKTVKSNTFKMSYNKRIQRPSLQFLNPFLNQSNAQSWSQGNPSLSPEITQTIEFNYSTFIKSSVINASVYYKRTNNIIESIATPIQNGTGENVTLTNFFNVGKNNSLGMSFFGSITPFKPLTIRSSINAFTYSPTANNTFLSQQSLTGTYVMYNIFAGGSLQLKGGIAMEMFGIFSSPRRTIQGKNPSFNMFGMGFKKELLQKKASLGINIFQPFQENINFNQSISGAGIVQNTTAAFPFRSVGLTFSYNFGKMNFNQQQKKRGVKNDDLKQGDQNGGMGGAPSQN